MATLFAANWKMHHGPERAAAFAQAFKELTSPDPDRSIWFFPPATSIRTLANEYGDRPDVAVGAQDVHWEPSGAYTGALSIPLASGTRGRGHSGTGGAFRAPACVPRNR